MAVTVDISLRPSLRALQALMALHTLLLLLLLVSGMPPLPTMSLAVALAASWLWLRRHPAFGFGPRACVRIVAHADNRWTLYRADGAGADAELTPDSIVSGALLILRFRFDDGRHLSRVIFGDEASDDALRRLRANLQSG